METTIGNKHAALHIKFGSIYFVTDIAFKTISNPTNYMDLSPAIMYISYKDKSPEKQLEIDMFRLNVVFNRKSCIFWNKSSTTDASFSANSSSKHVTLSLCDVNGEEITYSYQIGGLAQGLYYIYICDKIHDYA